MSNLQLLTRSPLSVTACEATAMSEAVVMDPPRADGFLESQCGAGDIAGSLDDVIVDTAKYVHTRMCPNHLDSTACLESFGSQPGC